MSMLFECWSNIIPPPQSVNKTVFIDFTATSDSTTPMDDDTNEGSSIWYGADDDDNVDDDEQIE